MQWCKNRAGPLFEGVMLVTGVSAGQRCNSFVACVLLPTGREEVAGTNKQEGWHPFVGSW
jgi:hypothetical protein